MQIKKERFNCLVEIKSNPKTCLILERKLAKKYYHTDVCEEQINIVYSKDEICLKAWDKQIK